MCFKKPLILALFDAAFLNLLSLGIFLIIIFQDVYTYRFNQNKPSGAEYNIRMYWTNFWQSTVHVQQNIFEKTLTEVCSPHLYASFDTFLLIFKHTSKTHCSPNDWPIWAQKVPKEVQRCGLPTSVWDFSKIFCCTWTVSCQKFVQYIRI